MSTRNFVPRQTGEGTIGTLLKKWLKGFFNSISVSGSITDETNNVTVAQLKTASDNQHTHPNKPTLDTYTQTEINLADAVSKKHGVNDPNSSHYTKGEADILLGNKQNTIGYIPENTASRRSAFQVTPDDNHYPSEKLVKDSLDSKLNTSLKGAINGLAELDGNGKVPSTQLPSYVDDVVEVANYAALPVTGETGKIYVTLDTNLTYRWSGSAYVEISASLALGETSSTAYRGDRGKTAYDHSQTAHAPSNATAGADWDTNVSNKPTLGTAAAKDTGTTAGTVAAGDDARLSDTRVPTNGTVNFLKLTGDIKQWLINNGYQAADQQIVPHLALPNNFAIANVAGIYSEFFKVQRFNWDPTNGFASTAIHPCFMIDGVEKEIFVGKYQACLLNAQGIVDNTSGLYAGSRKNVQQKSSTNFDQAQTFCEANNGGGITGFHLMTNAEWAALQIMAISQSTQPHGNTSYGKDDRNPAITGRCYTLNQFGVSSDQARWLTGSGGRLTAHNHDVSGVFDLSGNIWEWVGGLRLKDGEIQILENNNAGNASADMTLNSTSWKAILRDGSLVAPGTADTLKFDASGNVTIAATSGSGSHAFETQNLVSPVVATDAGVILLKKLGVIPYTSGLNGDNFWYNNVGEFVPLRGGVCADGSGAGVSALYLNAGRTDSNWNVGFRLAFAL